MDVPLTPLHGYDSDITDGVRQLEENARRNADRRQRPVTPDVER